MKSEYDWLLNFYLQLVAFEVVTCTFRNLSEIDRNSILEDINKLKGKFEIILPKIQDAP